MTDDDDAVLNRTFWASDADDDDPDAPVYLDGTDVSDVHPYLASAWPGESTSMRVIRARGGPWSCKTCGGKSLLSYRCSRCGGDMMTG